jgi:hypothetical protein
LRWKRNSLIGRKYCESLRALCAIAPWSWILRTKMKAADLPRKMDCNTYQVR